MSIIGSDYKVLFFKWDFAIVGNRNRHSPIVNLKSKGTLAVLRFKGRGKLQMQQWEKMQNPFPVPLTRNLNVLVTAKRNPLFI